MALNHPEIHASIDDIEISFFFFATYSILTTVKGKE